MSANATANNTCISCHAPYHVEDLYCTKCGFILPHVLDVSSTYHMDIQRDQPLDLQWGTGYFHARARLLLRDDKTDAVIPIPLQSASVIVGRSVGGAPVDIDLTPFGAVDLGVSRRHLRINRLRDSIRVTDLDSCNGTFLNRDRLTPGVSYLLRNRAVLQIGRMILRAQFV
jgi:FHA domain